MLVLEVHNLFVVIATGGYNCYSVKSVEASVGIHGEQDVENLVVR